MERNRDKAVYGITSEETPKKKPAFHKRKRQKCTYPRNESLRHKKKRQRIEERRKLQENKVIAKLKWSNIGTFRGDLQGYYHDLSKPIYVQKLHRIAHDYGMFVSLSYQNMAFMQCLFRYPMHQREGKTVQIRLCFDVIRMGLPQAFCEIFRVWNVCGCVFSTHSANSR